IASLFASLVLASAASAQPENIRKFLVSGSESVRKGEYEKAIKDYTEAIKLEPKFGPAYSARGAAYAQIGDVFKGISDFDEAIRLDPKDTTALYNRGLARGKLGWNEKAM